ncbi:MAG: peptidase U32 family protein [Alphaproteobacteria bacterium]
MAEKLELVCPAGTPAAFDAALEAGADTIYCGYRDATNARNFPGLNFSRKELKEAAQKAKDRGVNILLAMNTWSKAGGSDIWKQGLEDAAEIGVNAVILADIGLLSWAKENVPNLRRHLSVQASASNAASINYYVKEFDVKRVVLPRVLTLDEITALNSKIDVESEVFVFGGLCVMAEGRCSLSSYVTGLSPNKDGVCSPASHVSYQQQGSKLVSRLGGSTINVFDESENAGYPTLCKGRFMAQGKPSWLFEEPTSLSVIDILDKLQDAGVTALKIEGRQRSRAYVRQIVSAFRAAIDAIAEGKSYDASALQALSEGGRSTKGAYNRRWQ